MNTDFTKFKDKLFKIRQLAYNTYDIQHPMIKGQLRIIAVPGNFVQMARANTEDGIPQIGVGTQNVIGFSNMGKKLKPINSNISPDQLSSTDKEDITRYVENEHEPWNEFLLEDNLLVRLKTVLTKVTWVKPSVNIQGDPLLWVRTSINVDVSKSKIGESGLV